MMNERIKELETQAWDYAYDHETVKGKVAFDGFINANFSDEFSKNFAELIVRECMMLCGAVSGAAQVTRPNDAFGDGAEKCKALINQHFGVEE
jgi:hypothetical protein